MPQRTTANDLRELDVAPASVTFDQASRCWESKSQYVHNCRFVQSVHCVVGAWWEWQRCVLFEGAKRKLADEAVGCESLASLLLRLCGVQQGKH